jgi:hypothetical protein
VRACGMDAGRSQARLGGGRKAVQTDKHTGRQAGRQAAHRQDVSRACDIELERGGDDGGLASTNTRESKDAASAVHCAAA